MSASSRNFPRQEKTSLLPRKGRALVVNKTRMLSGTAEESMRKLQMAQAISRQAFTCVYCWGDRADRAKVAMKITDMKNKIGHTFKCEK